MALQGVYQPVLRDRQDRASIGTFSSGMDVPYRPARRRLREDVAARRKDRATPLAESEIFSFAHPQAAQRGRPAHEDRVGRVLHRGKKLWGLRLTFVKRCDERQHVMVRWMGEAAF